MAFDFGKHLLILAERGLLVLGQSLLVSVTHVRHLGSNLDLRGRSKLMRCTVSRLLVFIVLDSCLALSVNATLEALGWGNL